MCIQIRCAYYYNVPFSIKGLAVIINNISFEPDPALNITLDGREGANVDSGKTLFSSNFFAPAKLSAT